MLFHQSYKSVTGFHRWRGEEIRHEWQYVTPTYKFYWESAMMTVSVSILFMRT